MPSIRPEDAASGGSVEELSPVGLVYVDPNADVFFYIEQADWNYEKDRASGMIFFMNDKMSSPNSIALSSQPIPASKDPIDMIWEEILASQPLDTTITSSKDIVVGESRYKGRCYEFSFSYTGSQINMCYYIWVTQEKLYICSLAYEGKYRDQILSAGEDIIDSFKTMKELS